MQEDFSNETLFVVASRKEQEEIRMSLGEISVLLGFYKNSFVYRRGICGKQCRARKVNIFTEICEKSCVIYSAGSISFLFTSAIFCGIIYAMQESGIG